MSVLLFAVACVGLVLGLTLPRHQPALPPVMVLPSNYANPPQEIPIFARIVPANRNWAWLWKLKATLFGNIRSVLIEAQIVKLPGGWTPDFASPDLQTNLLPGSGTLSIWRLPDSSLVGLRQRLKQTPGAEFISSPRLSIGDGTEGSMFSGNTLVLNGRSMEAGIRLTCRASIRPGLTDLAAFVAYTDLLTNQNATADSAADVSSVIRTNLDVKTRFQIVNGTGIFLLQSSREGTNGNAMGVILSTKQ